MIKVERISVMNFENAIRGARNPLNSWERYDSYYDENGNFVDENGNVVDASDVVETTGSVSTGESTTWVYIGLGLMLAAAGVYFVTRKKKA